MFVLVFEKKLYWAFQSYTHFIYIFFLNHKKKEKKILFNPEASFHIISLVVHFSDAVLYEFVFKN